MSKSKVNPELEALIRQGWEKSNILYRFLRDNPVNPTLNWSNRVFFLAVLCLSSTMAKFVDLDKADFLALCEGFYDNVLVSIDHTSLKE